MDPKDKKIAEDVGTLFERVRSSQVDFDPYLETRVLAGWRERRRGGTASFWRRFAMAASAVSVALVVVLSLTLSRGHYPEAFVDESFAVKIEVRDLKRFKIVKAQILVPGDVAFDMDPIPGIENPREVTVMWKNEGQTHLLPFLLKSGQTGVKTIVVRFFDEKDQVVAEKKLSVRLKKPDA